MNVIDNRGEIIERSPIGALQARENTEVNWHRWDHKERLRQIGFRMVPVAIAAVTIAVLRVLSVSGFQFFR